MASSYFAPKQFIKWNKKFHACTRIVDPCNKTRAQEKKNDADKGINILIFTLYTIQGLKYVNWLGILLL